jgi:hypothetical protein
MAFSNLKKNRRDPLPSVAVKVEGYVNEDDRQMVRGTRLDTGEDVQVYLRADKSPKRPSLGDFANPEHPQLSTARGGTILFDGCYTDKDGNLSAKWPSCMNRTGKNANGIVMAGVMARIAVPKKGNPYLTIANQSGATVVRSREDFMGAALEALSKKVNGGFAPGNPGFILRGVDADGDVFTVVRNNDPKISVEDHLGKIVADLDDALFDYMESQGVWEVIPTANIGTGQFARENARHIDTASYLVGKNPKGDDVYGFAKSNVVINPVYKDNKVDGFFAKHATTVFFKPDGVPPGYVPTTNVNPKFDKEQYFSPTGQQEAEAESTADSTQTVDMTTEATASEHPLEPEEPSFG